MQSNMFLVRGPKYDQVVLTCTEYEVVLGRTTGYDPGKCRSSASWYKMQPRPARIELILFVLIRRIFKTYFQAVRDNGETQTLFRDFVKFSNFQKLHRSFCRVLRMSSTPQILAYKGACRPMFFTKNVTSLVNGLICSKSNKFPKIFSLR